MVMVSLAKALIKSIGKSIIKSVLTPKKILKKLGSKAGRKALLKVAKNKAKKGLLGKLTSGFKKGKDKKSKEEKKKEKLAKKAEKKALAKQREATFQEIFDKALDPKNVKSKLKNLKGKAKSAIWTAIVHSYSNNFKSEHAKSFINKALLGEDEEKDLDLQEIEFGKYDDFSVDDVEKIPEITAEEDKLRELLADRGKLLLSADEFQAEELKVANRDTLYLRKFIMANTAAIIRFIMKQLVDVNDKVYKAFQALYDEFIHSEMTLAQLNKEIGKQIIDRLDFSINNIQPKALSALFDRMDFIDAEFKVIEDDVREIQAIDVEMKSNLADRLNTVVELQQSNQVLALPAPTPLGLDIVPQNNDETTALALANQETQLATIQQSVTDLALANQEDRELRVQENEEKGKKNFLNIGQLIKDAIGEIVHDIGFLLGSIFALISLIFPNFGKFLGAIWKIVRWGLRKVLGIISGIWGVVKFIASKVAGIVMFLTGIELFLASVIPTIIGFVNELQAKLIAALMKLLGSVLPDWMGGKKLSEWGDQLLNWKSPATKLAEKLRNLSKSSFEKSFELFKYVPDFSYAGKMMMDPWPSPLWESKEGGDAPKIDEKNPVGSLIEPVKGMIPQPDSESVETPAEEMTVEEAETPDIEASLSATEEEPKTTSAFDDSEVSTEGKVNEANPSTVKTDDLSITTPVEPISDSADPNSFLQEQIRGLTLENQGLRQQLQATQEQLRVAQPIVMPNTTTVVPVEKPAEFGKYE